MPDELDNLLSDVPRLTRPKLPDAGRVRRRGGQRFDGTPDWSIDRLPEIVDFYLKQTGKPLPVSARGQGQVHNRWGYDHTNAADVALNPSSEEGQALISHLQQGNVPFSAFTHAIPGVATGPHIHIGKPLHKTNRAVPVGSTIAGQRDALDDLLSDVSQVRAKDELDDLLSDAPAADKDELDNLLDDVPGLPKHGLISTSSRVLDNDAEDLTDTMGNPLSVRPMDYPAESERSIAQKIAGGARVAASIKQNSDFTGLGDNSPLVAQKFPVSIKGNQQKYPTADEAMSAAIASMGADAVAVAEAFRQETGHNIAHIPNFDYKRARWNPENSSWEVDVQGAMALPRLMAAYKKGGYQMYLDEWARIDADSQRDTEAANAHEAVPRTWADIPLAAASDAGLAEAQVAHNVDMLARGVPIQDRYTPEYEKLEAEDRGTQEEINAAHQASPKEPTATRRVARETAASLLQAPMYIAAGPYGAAPLAYIQNLHRGQGEAIKQGMITAGTLGVGQGVGGVTASMSPAARQVATRGAMGVTQAGGAALSGETDPERLLSSFVAGAAQPIGKRAGDGESGTRPGQLFDEGSAPVRAPARQFTVDGLTFTVEGRSPRGEVVVSRDGKQHLIPPQEFVRWTGQEPPPEQARPAGWDSSAGVVSYGKRDVVKVVMPDGTVQPFYRSSGTNSKQPGKWFPFDGIVPAVKWFDKTRFTSGEALDVDHPLHRYGTPEYKAMAEALDQQQIPHGAEIPFNEPVKLNEWIGRNGGNGHNGRPVPVPERASTINAQMKAMQAGRRKAVLITPGTPEPKIPAGYFRTETPEGVMIHPQKLPRETVRKMVEDGTHGKLLGIVGEKGNEALSRVGAMGRSIRPRMPLLRTSPRRPEPSANNTLTRKFSSAAKS